MYAVILDYPSFPAVQHSSFPKCKVINKDGKIAKQFKVKEFIAKNGSPSCGCDQIYDGSFSGRLTPGDGVTTALLKRNGVRIIPEQDL